MRFRKFGTTDLAVSEIGFGAWAIGGAAMVGETRIGWGDADDNISLKAINAALDQGINFFDTADIYGLGHSETLIGKTVGHNKEVIIASKCGNVARKEKFTTDYSKDYLVTACEQSLRRLKREAIDYYQLHSARVNNLEDGECIAAMEQLKKQGKIRYWGISLNTFDPLPEAEYLMMNNQGSGFQLVLNLINQRALPLLSRSHENGYGVIARMPLQFGLLTGKFDEQIGFQETDHRKTRLTTGLVKNANEKLDPVWQLCKKYGCNKTQLALSYVLSYEEVSVVIPGIRSPAQVKENSTGLFQLEHADKTMIEETCKHEMEDLMLEIQKLG
jgi:aryl-alcohol dehydrogenase-like predicted oxidoreductase